MILVAFSSSILTSRTATIKADSRRFAEQFEMPTGVSTTEKIVLGEYHTWYQTKAISGYWTHWEWYTGAYHNPQRLLPDGRRDVASSYYPLIGPYDSIDLDVMKYHISLAKSIGIDGFLVDWYSTRTQEWRHGDESFRKMLDVAEEYDFYMTVSYEPKIYLIGWISHDTREEAIAAIMEDLVYALGNYGERKAFLKVDDKPVIFIWAAWLLTTDEWTQIRRARMKYTNELRRSLL